MLPVKVYFDLENDIRRYNLTASDGRGYFAALSWKISEVLGHDGFRIFWKDSDGDAISCGSEEELQVAIGASGVDIETGASKEILRVYVKVDKDTAEKRRTGSVCGSESSLHGTEQHFGVICDGCDSSILGTRYKCLVCPDYDLCGKCEAKGLHCQHDLLAIRHPSANDWRRLFAMRNVAYGKNDAAPKNHMEVLNENVSVREERPFWQFDEPRVELDLNLNQPFENLLKDVNNQVQKILKGFLPTTIPETSASLKEDKSTSSVPESANVETETVIETQVTHTVIKSADDNVETIHETVVEHATAIPRQSLTVESIYPNLSTASEEAQAIYITETPRLVSPITLLMPDDMENGWIKVNAEDNVTVESQQEKKSHQEDREAPSAKVRAALQTMEEMGFKNEGNLLRALLENFDGDIDRVLDTINQ